MDESPAPSPGKRSGAAVAIAAVVGLVLLAALYFLSLGPWNWAIHHGYISPETTSRVGGVYYPIDFCCRNSEAFTHVTITYIGLWVDPAVEPQPPANSGTITW